MTGPTESARRRGVWAVKHGVQDGACARCRAWTEALDFVTWRHGKQMGQSDVCRPCRIASRTTHAASGETKFNYLAAAEACLYPRRHYHDLTAMERRHTYWLARTWWLRTPYPAAIPGFDIPRAHATLAGLAMTLADAGFPLTPVPPCPAP